MSEQEFAKRRVFRSLHEQGCFVIPNPWDRGSARYLKHLGFQALATTSGGLAFSRGLPDTDWAVSRDVVLAHIKDIVSSVELPIHADFESGYARDPETLAGNVTLCIESGVAGLSIEDATGDRARPLFELPLAVERLSAARAAIDASGSDVSLTARAECFLVGHPAPLDESIRRLQLYAEAGANVLFAPGIQGRDDIRTLVGALSPKPVNVLVGRDLGLSVQELAELGVRRISVGSALFRAAWTAFSRAAREIAEGGSFTAFGDLVPFPEINGFFRSDASSVLFDEQPQRPG